MFMTADGFSPQTIAIASGDTVEWINLDSALHWPASDPHPTHTGVPEFDARGDLSQGESYSFTFAEVGNFIYHDHTLAREDDPVVFTGIVTVSE